MSVCYESMNLLSSVSIFGVQLFCEFIWASPFYCLSWIMLDMAQFAHPGFNQNRKFPERWKADQKDEINGMKQ